MLVLTRKLGESIVIDSDIRITVLNVEGSRVQIGIAAPKGIRIRREELLDRPLKSNSANGMSARYDSISD